MLRAARIHAPLGRLLAVLAVLALVIALIVIGTSPSAQADTISVTSTADSEVKEDRPTQNAGTAAAMRVKTHNVKDARAFVQFNLSSIPPSSTVTSATLTLCPTTAVPSSTRTYDLHRVTSSWAETTVTWGTQPTVSATATDTATTPPSTATCMTWTVSSDVQAIVDGTATNNGWRVKDQVEGSATKLETKFGTREHTTAGDHQHGKSCASQECQPRNRQNEIALEAAQRIPTLNRCNAQFTPPALQSFLQRMIELKYPVTLCDASLIAF